MGAASANEAGDGQDRPLDPATALTVAEAATLAGVGSPAIESSMADGSLLFETQRQKGREVPMIRLMDLADVFPALRSVTEPVETSQLFAVGEDEEGVDGAAHGTMADAVRASGADRNALIELCQDLESRLDLAERERQASTASLLMAQRRVLDLEHRRDRRPMAMAAAATLGLFGLALAFVAFRLPETVSAAARKEVQQAESRFAKQNAQLEASIAASIEGSLEASRVAARQTERERSEALSAEYESRVAELEARLDEARKLHLAELKKVSTLAQENVAEERTAAAREREAAAKDRRAELAAWKQRIEDAEEATGAAREALKLERALNGADRAAFRSELETALAQHSSALDAALERMVESKKADNQLPFGPVETKEAPAPWWKRALGDLRD